MFIARIVIGICVVLTHSNNTWSQQYTSPATPGSSLLCPASNDSCAMMQGSLNGTSSFQAIPELTSLPTHLGGGLPQIYHNPIPTIPVNPSLLVVPQPRVIGVAPHSCVNCDNGCHDPCASHGNNPCGGLLGGVELIWIRPNFDQNVAMVVDPPIGNKSVPFEYGYRLSPRVWLGWQNRGGTGIRATYFQIDEAADSESITAVAGATPVYLFVYGAGGNLSRNAYANTGQTLTSNHALKLNSLDLEATQLHCWRQSRAIFGLGVRIANIQQTMRAEAFTPGGTLEEAVGNQLDFSGAGPTVSAQLSRGIGASRFGFFASTRASLLMSETEQRIYEMKGAYTTELEDIAIQRKILSNFELGLGLQFAQPLGRMAVLSVRVGCECQVWFDTGGPVDSRSNLGFDGITLAMGVNY